MKIDAYVVEGVNAPFVREELELDPPGPGEVLVLTKTTSCLQRQFRETTEFLFSLF